MTVRVKICGVTRLDDALAAIDAGADALGLNCWPGSKRYLAPRAAEKLVAKLPPLVSLVGVFVDQPKAQVAKLAKDLGLHAVQLHGEESVRECQGLGVPVIRAVKVTGRSALRGLSKWPVAALLVDTPSPGHGGSGRTFDWRLLRGWRAPKPLLLAGGLTPKNVAAAVRAVSPYAVDVASGVESSPGRKDERAMRAFVRAAKGAR